MTKSKVKTRSLKGGVMKKRPLSEGQKKGQTVNTSNAPKRPSTAPPPPKKKK